MAQKVGKFYASVVAQRISENQTAPPPEIKRMPKKVVKAMKQKYSVFFDTPKGKDSQRSPKVSKSATK